MMFDKTESLIRDTLTDQANRAVDPETVLRELRKGRRHARPAVLVFATAAVVIAVVSAVVIPGLLRDRQTAVGAPEAPAPMADQTVLVLGRDGWERTDTIMLVRLTSTGLMVISLPRDVNTEIPGHGRGRINAAFDVGRRDAESRGLSPAESLRAGAAKVVDTVGSLTGVRADHFVVIDMASLPALVDAVGGVEVCLRKAAADMLSGTRLSAGRQTLSGSQALSFVRQRHGLPNGDLDRIERQQAVVTALAARVMSAGDLGSVVAAVRDRVTTDLDLVGLAQQASGRTVRLGVIPIEDGAYDASGLAVAPDKVRSYVREMFAGTGPQGGGEAVGEPACVD
ncbi:LCP family protein [Actinokineospora sp. HUAS TT18]|uniref:LCP family protein n=1 Tax=Actinokineospora sp. HUAS TT18 TaxID=3447451 RepID=UPI003F522468